ncbi:ABC transporter substrate-binding protein [Imhoffiella purpurea]|uniref:Extracellular solute-binding protein, family 3 n=1 Tax=Imhoffiella purpurea TaxID=1249627 RepID=W9VFN8_9GAMM|nr:ABC transporter substrate-binding protein [Imhoffiella purpurea]EXJ14832.1 extracellular solute-binding protein, family 3 [Imhoffiella purpurea]
MPTAFGKTRASGSVPGRGHWHLILGLILAGLTLVATARPGSAQEPSSAAEGRPDLAPDIARIVDRGELIVAMADMNTPPFFYRQGDDLAGLEVDMARELARELRVGIRFDRSAKTFNDVIDVVAGGKADLGISKLSRTLSRAGKVRFSDPYLRLHHALAFNRLALARMAMDTPIPSIVRNFRGSLGVIADSSFADFAKRHFPQASIRTYSSWPEVVAAVRSGEVVGAYRDEFEIKRLITSNPTIALTLRTVTLTDLEDTLGIAVGADSPVLLDLVNLFLAQRQEKLTIDKVLDAVKPYRNNRPAAPSMNPIPDLAGMDRDTDSKQERDR